MDRTTRVRVIAPLVGLTLDQVALRRELLARYAAPGTEVTFETVEQGPDSIESHWEEEWAATAFFEAACRLKPGEADAVITWCASNPGAGAAREVLSIPVVGPGEAAITLAGMLSHKFSILPPLRQEVSRMEMLAGSLGYRDRLASVRPLGIPVLEMRRDEAVTVASIAEVGRRCVEEDGAGALVLACMGMFGLAEKVQAELGIPVIDPGVAALRVAELLVASGLTYSRASYPTPSKLPKGLRVSR